MTTKLRAPKIQAKVAERMREQIRAGQLKPGDRLPSYSAMVAEHGVSTVTVDRIYNFLEQEGLIVREQGRGTFVAQPKTEVLKSGIALYAPLPNTENAGTAYWTELSAGIREVLQAEGQKFTVLDTLGPDVAEHCDGLLLMSFTPLSEIRRYTPPSFPVVALVIPHEEMTSVLSDDIDGVRQSVEYLLALGHKRIAYLSDGSDGVLANWRLDSYRATIQAAGIEALDSWVHLGAPDTIIPNYLVWGRETMNRWLQEDWHEQGCTALVTQNDEMAVGAMQALQEAGIRIPEQVAVIGFDSTIWCDFVAPTLTSVEIPLRAMGRRATELLMQQIRGEREADNTETVLLPTKLVVRQSARAAPSEAEANGALATIR
jgi:DNA-binding LacI/PurR family transcriptional regulator